MNFDINLILLVVRKMLIVHKKTGDLKKNYYKIKKKL